MNDLVILVLQILTLALFLFVAAFQYYDWKLGAASVPSSAAGGRAMAALIPEGAALAVDLGSGWGGLAFAAARARPGTRVVGVEYALPPYLYSVLKKAFCPGLKNLSFARADLFKYPVGDVSAALCYMPPEMMARMADKFSELPPGAVIISNSESLPGRSPEKTVEVPGLFAERIYLYRV